MIDEELKNAIVEKQGNLLYTTLAEECTELAQACCKINRQKFYNKNIVKELTRKSILFSFPCKRIRQLL